MTISEAPFDNQQLLQWTEEVAQEYPNHRDMKDRGPAMICHTLKGMISPGGTLVVHIAHDGPILYGLIAYMHWKKEPCFSLLQYAVLPRHRNKGIGAALLERVKQKASRMGLPIIAGGMLDPAFPRLEKAGFWKARERRGDPLYKWSDVPEQQNNHVPGYDGD